MVGECAASISVLAASTHQTLQVDFVSHGAAQRRLASCPTTFGVVAAASFVVTWLERRLSPRRNSTDSKTSAAEVWSPSRSIVEMQKRQSAVSREHRYFDPTLGGGHRFDRPDRDPGGFASALRAFQPDAASALTTEILVEAGPLRQPMQGTSDVESHSGLLSTS
jgi:hypothetical protein